MLSHHRYARRPSLLLLLGLARSALGAPAFFRQLFALRREPIACAPVRAAISAPPPGRFARCGARPLRGVLPSHCSAAGKPPQAASRACLPRSLCARQPAGPSRGGVWCAGSPVAAVGRSLCPSRRWPSSSNARARTTPRLRARLSDGSCAPGHLRRPQSAAAVGGTGCLPEGITTPPPRLKAGSGSPIIRNASRRPQQTGSPTKPDVRFCSASSHCTARCQGCPCGAAAALTAAVCRRRAAQKTSTEE